MRARWTMWSETCTYVHAPSAHRVVQQLAFVHQQSAWCKIRCGLVHVNTNHVRPAIWANYMHESGNTWLSKYSLHKYHTMVSMPCNINQHSEKFLFRSLWPLYETALRKQTNKKPWTCNVIEKHIKVYELLQNFCLL